MFFILMSRYFIAKLEVCCHHASKLCYFTADVSQSILIERFVKRHLKILNMIDTANSIYKFINIGQLLSALGLFVVVTLQIRYGLDFPLMIMFMAVMVQLLLYCYLSERINGLVELKMLFEYN